MARPRSGTRTMRRAMAAALLAVVPLLAACHAKSHVKSSSGSRHHSSTHTPSAGPSPSAGSGAQGLDQSTVASATGAWVGAVIAEDAKRACMLSAEPGDGSSPAQGMNAQKCDASTTQKMADGLKAMSKAFTPKNASGTPTVKVEAPTPAGDKASVPTAKIMVDGRPLRAILLAGSKGVNPKTFTAKLEAERIGGKWYVGDFDINGGSETLKPRAQS
ncbi:hypothetical protein [Streptomyces sp. 8L]|uniref:hypothetical protein n=1 Tax=Streptomyces sp. 8L TaxID=2877242 RepID=UPI001CD59654|nr:hypothetical protein [Streptomyces sp. 8L]MCA1217209.1 hypothetical protein [Streptomyces sp. 8L]